MIGRVNTQISGRLSRTPRGEVGQPVPELSSPKPDLFVPQKLSRKDALVSAWRTAQQHFVAATVLGSSSSNPSMAVALKELVSNGLSALESGVEHYKRGRKNFVDVRPKNRLFTQSFARQLGKRLEKADGANEKQVANLQNKSFLECYRLAASLAPGLPSQLALASVKELLTDGDRRVWDQIQQSKMGSGEVVAERQVMGQTVREITHPTKAGGSSLTAGYVPAGNRLSPEVKKFAAAHEASHVKHQDHEAYIADTLVQSLLDAESQEAIGESFEYRLDSRRRNHEKELRCDREAFEYMVSQGTGAAELVDTLEKGVFVIHPSSTQYHPSDESRLQQLRGLADS